MFHHGDGIFLIADRIDQTQFKGLVCGEDIAVAKFIKINAFGQSFGSTFFHQHAEPVIRGIQYFADLGVVFFVPVAPQIVGDGFLRTSGGHHAVGFHTNFFGQAFHGDDAGDHPNGSRDAGWFGHDALASRGDVHATRSRDASVAGKDRDVLVAKLLEVVVDSIRWRDTTTGGVHTKQHGIHVVALGPRHRGRDLNRGLIGDGPLNGNNGNLGFPVPTLHGTPDHIILNIHRVRAGTCRSSHQAKDEGAAGHKNGQHQGCEDPQNHTCSTARTGGGVDHRGGSGR